MDYFLTWFTTKEWGVQHWSKQRWDEGLALLNAGASADDWRVFMYGA